MAIAFFLVCLVRIDSCEFVPLDTRAAGKQPPELMMFAGNGDAFQQRRVRTYNEIYQTFYSKYNSYFETAQDSAMVIHQYGTGNSISKSVVIDLRSQSTKLITYRAGGARVCFVNCSAIGLTNKKLQHIAVSDNVPAPHPWPFHDRDPRTYVVEERMKGERRIYFVSIEGLSSEHFEKPYTLTNESGWFAVERMFELMDEK